MEANEEMIISLRSLNYEELKKLLTKEDKIVIWSCDTCIKHVGLAGYDKMQLLESMLKADGYNVIKKELLGVSCREDVVNDRKIDEKKKNIFKEATAIICLTCEAGWDEVSAAFSDKKVIKTMKTLGAGICSETRGIYLSNPFEDVPIEPSPLGNPISEVAKKLGLYDKFFDADVQKLPEPKMVEITINGKKYMVKDNANLLEECERIGFKIPHLCYIDCLSPVGACRLCVTKIEGMRGLTPACCTMTKEKMVVVTDDDQLHEYRKMILELMLAARHHNCLFCSHNNHCEFQALIHEFGIEETRFPINPEWEKVDETSNAFVKDPNRCILCGRCVRACDELAGKHNLEFVGRGNLMRLGAGMNQDLGDSDCATCLACVYACPTGALHEKMYHYTGANWEREKVYGYYDKKSKLIKH